MNYRCLEMTSHYEQGPVHCLISIASQCPGIFFMIQKLIQKLLQNGTLSCTMKIDAKRQKWLSGRETNTTETKQCSALRRPECQWNEKCEWKEMSSALPCLIFDLCAKTAPHLLSYPRLVLFLGESAVPALASHWTCVQSKGQKIQRLV